MFGVEDSGVADRREEPTEGPMVRTKKNRARWFYQPRVYVCLFLFILFLVCYLMLFVCLFVFPHQAVGAGAPNVSAHCPIRAGHPGGKVL